LTRHEKFSEQNFNKIQRSLLNQVEFGSNCAVEKHIKILVNTILMEICMSANNISGPTFWSVSNTGTEY